MWVTQLSLFCRRQWREEPCSSSCRGRRPAGAAVASPKLFAVDRWSKKRLSLTFPVFPLFSQTPLLAVPDGSGARQRREGDQENQVLLSALPALPQVAAGLPATGRRPGGEELPPAQLGLPELPRRPQPAGEPRLLRGHQPLPVQHGTR